MLQNVQEEEADVVGDLQILEPFVAENLAENDARAQTDLVVHGHFGNGEQRVGQKDLRAKEPDEVLRLNDVLQREERQIEQNGLVVEPLGLNALVEGRVAENANERVDVRVDELFVGKEGFRVRAPLSAPPETRRDQAGQMRDARDE